MEPEDIQLQVKVSAKKEYASKKKLSADSSDEFEGKLEAPSGSSPEGRGGSRTLISLVSHGLLRDIQSNTNNFSQQNNTGYNHEEVVLDSRDENALASDINSNAMISRLDQTKQRSRSSQHFEVIQLNNAKGDIMNEGEGDEEIPQMDYIDKDGDIDPQFQIGERDEQQKQKKIKDFLEKDRTYSYINKGNTIKQLQTNKKTSKDGICKQDNTNMEYDETKQENPCNMKLINTNKHIQESQQNIDSLQAMDGLKNENKKPSVKKQNHNYVIDYQEDNNDEYLAKDGNTSLKKSIHSSSSLDMEGYFEQDIEKKKQDQMKRIIVDISKFKSYFVKFRLGIFFEFFFYHFLFLNVLGPLGNPILYLFGKGLPRNLMFWGFNPGFAIQTMNYILNMLIILVYSIYTPNFILFQSEIIYLVIGMFYRMFTIAVKYATFDPIKIQALREHSYEPKVLAQDFILLDWTLQNDRIIHEEIYFALRAYEIDVSWFFLEFIIPLEEETIDKLTQNCHRLSAFHLSQKYPFQPQSIHITSQDKDQFYIPGLIKELIDRFQKEHAGDIRCVKYFSMTYGVIRSLVPTVYKAIYDDGQMIREGLWYEWIISFFAAFLTYSFYNMTVWIILQGIIDLRRKIFFMEQMAFMLSPRKMRSIDSDKIFPTINIFRSANLKAWQLMRQVCNEYGKRYDTRVQATFQALTVVCGASIVILFLQNTKVIQLEHSFMMILLIETIFSVLVLSRIVYFGAKINQMFDMHDGILNQNKNILMDIYRMRRRYFNPEFKTTNYLYTKAITKIKNEIQLLNLANPCAHIKEIVDSYDSHIDELNFDREQNPFRIGSIKITDGLLQSGLLGLASLIVALVSRYFQSPITEN